MEFYSDRDIPLIYPSTAPLPSCPIVTVEMYSKWYDVYVIEVDGFVVKVDHLKYARKWGEAIRDTYDKGLSFLGDHVWHPYGIQAFADLIGGEVQDEALEMLVGRWVTEHKNTPLEDI